jgi:hypothetical protein
MHKRETYISLAMSCCRAFSSDLFCLAVKAWDSSSMDPFASEVDFGGLVRQHGHVDHSTPLRPVLSNVELDHRCDGCDRVRLSSEL